MVKENKTEKKQPAYKIKKGAIDGTVWANEKEGTKGKFTSYSVNIEKSFTRDDGQTWEKSKGYFAQDIDNLEKVVAGIKAFLTSKEVRTNVQPKENKE